MNRYLVVLQFFLLGLIASFSLGCAGTRSTVKKSGASYEVFPLTPEQVNIIMKDAIVPTTGASTTRLDPPSMGYRGKIEFALDRHDFVISAKPVILRRGTPDEVLAFGFEVTHSGTFLFGPIRAAGIYKRALESARIVSSPIPITQREFLMGQPEINSVRYSQGEARQRATGTAFFISTNGFLISAEHVIGSRQKITVLFEGVRHPAAIVRRDSGNDLVLLKVEGTFPAIPIDEQARPRLGDPVFTIGYPNPDLQGNEPKYTSGDISSLNGLGDDFGSYQISVPIQPGNSGGPLVDSYGNVIGVVVAKLDDGFAFSATGTLPQTVNYARKSQYIGLLLQDAEAAHFGLLPPNLDEMPKSRSIQAVERATVRILAE